MKLVRLIAENFQRLEAVDITFGDGVTELSGGNDQGKTSTLNAIFATLKDASFSPDDPIRHGTEEAAIQSHLKDDDGSILIATRTYEYDAHGKLKNELRLTTPTGAKYPQAATHLKKIVSDHLLDPLEFLLADPKHHVSVLESFAPGFDFAANKREHDGVFARRTDVKREQKRELAAAEAIRVPPDTRDAIIEVSELSKQVEDAIAKNLNIQGRRENRARAREQIEKDREAARLKLDSVLSELDLVQQATDEAADRIQRQIDALLREQERIKTEGTAKLVSKRETIEAEAAALTAKCEETERKIAEAGELPPETPAEAIQAIRDQISNATRLNKQFADKQQREKHLKAEVSLRQTVEQLTAQLEKIEKARRDAIASCKLPVEGLDFDDEGIKLNGVIWKQVGDGTRMRIAVALSVAKRPNIRLCWIRNAALLDDNALKMVADLAKEFDCQIIIETVRPVGGDAIVLEEGHIKGQEPQFVLTAPESASSQNSTVNEATRTEGIPAAEAVETPAVKADAPKLATRPRRKFVGPGDVKGEQE